MNSLTRRRTPCGALTSSRLRPRGGLRCRPTMPVVDLAALPSCQETCARRWGQPECRPGDHPMSLVTCASSVCLLCRHVPLAICSADPVDTVLVAVALLVAAWGAHRVGRAAAERTVSSGGRLAVVADEPRRAFRPPQPRTGQPSFGGHGHIVDGVASPPTGPERLRRIADGTQVSRPPCRRSGPPSSSARSCRLRAVAAGPALLPAAAGGPFGGRRSWPHAP